MLEIIKKLDVCVLSYFLYKYRVGFILLEMMLVLGVGSMIIMVVI